MLTRAKSLLIIIGHAETLEENSRIWKELITHCRENKSIIYGASPFEK